MTACPIGRKAAGCRGGETFPPRGRGSAVGSRAGGAAVGVFCLAYALTAARRGWMASTACGLTVFFGGAVLLRFLPLSLWPTFVAVFLLLLRVRFLLPAPDRRLLHVACR